MPGNSTKKWKLRKKVKTEKTPKLIKKLEFQDADYKITKVEMLQKIEEKVENFTRPLEHIKNNQIEILELQNTMKLSTWWKIYQIDTAEGLKSDLGGKSGKHQKHRRKSMKNTETSIKTYGTRRKLLTFV